MTIQALYQDLLSAVSLRGPRAVIRVTASYEPAGGPGSKVFPPTYPRAADWRPSQAEDRDTRRSEDSSYVMEARWVNGGRRETVLLDAEQSQANRAEEALLRARRTGVVQLPLLQIEHSGATSLVLTSLEVPHRYADAYLRDSTLGGVAFDKSALGRSLQAATPHDATAVYAHDPGSLVFGAWNSHRKGRREKFPRVYASVIVGWDPVVGARNAGRMDPLNLQGGRKPTADGESWDHTAVATKKKGERLSEIGHGNIPAKAQPGGVTISSAQRIATLSLAALDRIGFGTATPDAALAARAVLAAYALLADRLAFGGASLWLRSGCDLVQQSERMEWVNRGGGTDPVELCVDQAVELFTLASAHAMKHGLPLDTDVVTLAPTERLARAIDYSLTKAVPAEDDPA